MIENQEQGYYTEPKIQSEAKLVFGMNCNQIWFFCWKDHATIIIWEQCHNENAYRLCLFEWNMNMKQRTYKLQSSNS